MTALNAEDRETSCAVAFNALSEAMGRGVLIERVSRQDKEFHFQNWVERRLGEAGLDPKQNGRNSFPDFTLVDYPEGYEVKGLAWPGREANYDSNSRVPAGQHGGRTVFYVFGRYPARAEENAYRVVDLVVCHGDFLNPDRDYVHENQSFRGFGSYGDLLVRDRKMYVAPTPFVLADGTATQQTLIVPAGFDLRDEKLEPVGDLIRVETEHLVTGYSFDLRRNVIEVRRVRNPHAGREHHFKAYRRRGVGHGSVVLRAQPTLGNPLPDEDGRDA